MGGGAQDGMRFSILRWMQSSGASASSGYRAVGDRDGDGAAVRGRGDETTSADETTRPTFSTWGEQRGDDRRWPQTFCWTSPVQRRAKEQQHSNYYTPYWYRTGQDRTVQDSSRINGG